MPKKIINKKILILILTIVIAVIFLLFALNPEASEQKLSEKGTVTIPVTVLELEPGDYRPLITLMGEVVPQWQTIIKTQVYGQVDFISPQFRVGEIIENDDVLVRLEDQQLGANLAEAELRLINAKTTLKNEESLQRKAFLEAARKEVDVAQKQLEAAQNELEKSVIRSPYKGLIVERFVNKGDVLFAGDHVALLYGTEKSIISIFLDARQWSFLPENFDDIEVSLFDSESGNKWTAAVTREGQLLKPESRLRPLFIEIENPLEMDPPILTGTFLSVQLRCDYIKDLLKIPESAYTNSGLIWYLENNKMQSVKVEPLFRENDNIYIEKPEIIPSPVLIVNAPNSAFIDGMTVSPEILKGDK